MRRSSSLSLILAALNKYLDLAGNKYTQLNWCERITSFYTFRYTGCLAIRSLTLLQNTVRPLQRDPLVSNIMFWNTKKSRTHYYTLVRCT